MTIEVSVNPVEVTIENAPVLVKARTGDDPVMVTVDNPVAHVITAALQGSPGIPGAEGPQGIPGIAGAGCLPVELVDGAVVQVELSAGMLPLLTHSGAELMIEITACA